MIRYINAQNKRNRTKNAISSKKMKASIKKTKEKKEQNILRILNDKNNPYSNLWTNQLLATRYRVNLKVDGFLNGVPQFKIHKLKDCELPYVRQKIIFTFILDLFTK